MILFHYCCESLCIFKQRDNLLFDHLDFSFSTIIMFHFEFNFQFYFLSIEINSHEMIENDASVTMSEGFLHFHSFIFFFRFDKYVNVNAFNELKFFHSIHLNDTKCGRRVKQKSPKKRNKVERSER